MAPRNGKDSYGWPKKWPRTAKFNQGETKAAILLNTQRCSRRSTAIEKFAKTICPSATPPNLRHVFGTHPGYGWLEKQTGGFISIWHARQVMACGQAAQVTHDEILNIRW